MQPYKEPFSGMAQSIGDSYRGAPTVVNEYGANHNGVQQDEIDTNFKKAPYTPEKPLSFLDIAPEIAALVTNRVQPVRSQHYTPELQQGYETSLQDARNKVTGVQRAAQTMMGYNPAAMAAIAGNTAEQLAAISEKEFQTNLGIKADTINKNTATLNEARLKNMGIDDLQYTRQEQAKSNTRMQDNEILKSISAKTLQNKADYKKLNTYENLYGFRFDPVTGEAIYKGPNINTSYAPNTRTGKTSTTKDEYGVSTKTVETKDNDIKKVKSSNGISLIRRAKF